MRKIVILLINIILLSVALFVCVYAHSGKTNSKGGHYDHQHGGYHYHHGYPAHSHTNGVCPYDDDDDKTNHRSNNGNSNNSNSNKNTSSASNNPSNSDDTPTKQQKTKGETHIWKNIVGIGFGMLICSPLILSFLFFIYYRIILPVLEYAKKKLK